jgi:hypothetical protein
MQRQEDLGRCFLCGGMTPWKLEFRQFSFNRTDRVLRSMGSTTSPINRFPEVLYFPLVFRLISGNSGDPQVIHFKPVHAVRGIQLAVKRRTPTAQPANP